MQKPICRAFTTNKNDGPEVTPVQEKAKMEQAIKAETSSAETAAAETSAKEDTPLETSSESELEQEQEVEPNYYSDQDSDAELQFMIDHGLSYVDSMILGARMLDQRQLVQSEYLFSQKSIPIMEIDVAKLRADLVSEIQSEKSEFLSKLDAHEQAIQDDYKRRVFAHIGVIDAIKRQEREFLTATATLEKNTDEEIFRWE